jgi:hypothetical protein
VEPLLISESALDRPPTDPISRNGALIGSDEANNWDLTRHVGLRPGLLDEKKRAGRRPSGEQKAYSELPKQLGSLQFQSGALRARFFGEVTVSDAPTPITHDTVAAIRQFQVLPHGNKGVSFGDQDPSQHSAGAFTCKFAQRIVDDLN